MKKSIKLNALLFFIPNVVAAFCSIISLPFLTQKLDLVDFGYFFLCSILVNLFGIFTSFGSSYSMARYFHGKNKNDQEIFLTTLSILSATSGFIICLLLALFWNHFIPRVLPEISEIKTNQLYIIFFSIFIYGFQLYVSEILTITRQAFLFGIFVSSQSVVGALVNIYLILNYNLGVDTLFYALFASNLVGFTFISLIFSKYLVLNFDFKLLKKLLLEYKIIVANIFEVFFYFIERNLINRFIGLEFFAIFSHSKNYEKILINTNTAITRSVTPRALSDFKKYKKFDNCHKANNYIVLFTFIFCIFFSTIGFDFISIISNNKFSEASYLIGLWALTLFFKSTNLLYTVVILLKGDVKSYSNITYFEKLPLLILLIILLPLFDLGAIIISYSVSAILLKLYFLRTAKSLYKISFEEKNIFKIFLICSLTLILSIYLGDSFIKRFFLFSLNFLLGMFMFQKELSVFVDELKTFLFYKKNKEKI